jgi:hypothetical protein
MDKLLLWCLAVSLAACETTAESVPSMTAGDAGAPTIPASMPDAAPGAANDGSAPPRDGALPPDAPAAPAPADAAAAPTPADAATLGPPTGACPSPMMCAAIAAEYEQALGAAASCMVGKDACGIKVATTLRCGSCEAWVSDDKVLAATRARFVSAGCEGCSFRLGPDGKCGPGACVSLTTPMCVGNGGIDPGLTGTCGNTGGERLCPDGLRTGAPCSPAPDYCIGNGHVVCSCGTVDRKWTCI